MEVVANDINTPNIATYRLLSCFCYKGPPDLALNSCFEYRVRNNTEMQGAKQVFTTEAQKWHLSRLLYSFTVKSSVSIERLKCTLHAL